MSKETPQPEKEGGRTPLPPALERKLQRRAKTGRFTPAQPPQPPRGGRATRTIRHQGR